MTYRNKNAQHGFRRTTPHAKISDAIDWRGHQPIISALTPVFVPTARSIQPETSNSCQVAIALGKRMSDFNENEVTLIVLWH